MIQSFGSSAVPSPYPDFSLPIMLIQYYHLSKESDSRIWGPNLGFLFLNVPSELNLVVNPLYSYLWKRLLTADLDSDTPTDVFDLFPSCEGVFLHQREFWDLPLQVFFCFFSVVFQTIWCCSAPQCIISFSECTKLLIPSLIKYFPFPLKRFVWFFSS